MSSQFQLEWFIDQASHEKQIKDFLKEKEISRTALTDIKFKGGRILVNGEEVTVRYKLKNGDLLKIIFPKEAPSGGVQGEDLPLSILFEDDYLLVINKPAGMSTIPSREHPYGSLANALVGYYQHAGLLSTAHIVTRLDRDTSGIVLVAKHRHVHHLFSMDQQNGKVKRTYEAFAGGKILKAKGTIEQPIGRKQDSIIEREVRADGQYACTHFSVIDRFDSFTHIELQLETGRTHQIRVHMSFVGHPLLGDDLYGGDTSQIDRQALHCKQIKFTHPFSGHNMTFMAPLPTDMEVLLKANRLY